MKTYGKWTISLLLLALAALSAPSEIRAAGTARVSLEWNSNTEPDFAYYNVYRATAPEGPFVRINASPVTLAQYIDENLDHSYTYYYYVTAIDNASNESEPSNVDSATTLAPPSPNEAPTADAGLPQTFYSGQSATLDGSASSDPDGVVSFFLWTQIDGPLVQFLDENSSVTSFIAPIVVTTTTLTFELNVWDDDSEPAPVPALVSRYIGPPNAAVSSLQPDAGDDQQVRVGQRVRLDGSNSVALEGNIIAYFWIQTSGPVAEIEDESSSVTTFLAPTVATSDPTPMDFQLYIWSDLPAEASDEVQIMLRPDWNKYPTVDPGENQTQNEGTLVTLDGSNSIDVDGTIIASLWIQEDGPTVAIDNSTNLTTTFIAPEVDETTTLTFSLTVWDNELSSITAETKVAVFDLATDLGPIARAGTDQSVNVGDPVTLDGSASSDPGGEIQSYAWTLVSSTPGVTLSGAATPTATFTAPTLVGEDNNIVFELRVTDDGGIAAVDRVVVSVNRAPTANAGGDQTAFERARVSLDGSNSTDLDQDVLTYNWEQIETGGVSAVKITDPSVMVLQFNAPNIPGNVRTAPSVRIKFKLTVSDGNLSDTIDVVVVVRNRATKTTTD